MMTSMLIRKIKGISLKGFGVVPWLVWISAVVTLLALTIFRDASSSVLIYMFPVWALMLAFGIRDNAVAPVYGFPIFYLLWLWFGSVGFLPASNLPTTLLDPIPSRIWFYYLLGFVGYFGAIIWSGKPRGKIERLLGYRPTWETGRFFLLLGVIFLITMSAWVAITAREGIPIFRTDVNYIRVTLPERHHVLYQVEIIGADFLLPLLFMYRWSTRPRRLVNGLLWGVSIALFFVLVSQGNRGLALPPLLTILIMRHILVRPWRLIQVIPVGLVAFVALAATGYYRSVQAFGETFIDDRTKLGVPLALQPYIDIYFYIRAPLSTFRDVARLIPTVYPYQWGRLSFGAVLQILPGRHPSSDFFFKHLLGDTFTGFGEPASMLGTFYADFGPLGVLFGMAGVGFLIAQVFRVMIVTSRAHWLLIYAFLLQRIIGGMYGSLFEYVIEILLPIVWFLLLRHYAQPSSYRTAGAPPRI